MFPSVVLDTIERMETVKFVPITVPAVTKVVVFSVPISICWKTDLVLVSANSVPTLLLKEMDKKNVWCVIPTVPPALVHLLRNVLSVEEIQF